MVKIGYGNMTSGNECLGTLRVVEDVADVLRLMKEDLSATIVFTASASATIITPLFPKIKGVICTQGGATSHLAIVAREFDLACVMGSHIDYEGELDGSIIRFNTEGEIFLET